jgi:hypothetical protein
MVVRSRAITFLDLCLIKFVTTPLLKPSHTFKPQQYGKALTKGMEQGIINGTLSTQNLLLTVYALAAYKKQFVKSSDNRLVGGQLTF